jgi:hypothetical protein
MKFEITTAKEFQRGYDRKQTRTPIASEQLGIAIVILVEL